MRLLSVDFRGQFTVLSIVTFCFAPFCEARALDREPSESEIGYLPAEAEVLEVNPPAFVWLPIEGHTDYLLEYSLDHSFSPDLTTTVTVEGRQVFIPSETLKPGHWFWRYGIPSSDSVRWSRTRDFIIEEDAIALPFPDIKQVIESIPTTRPRLYYTPELVEKIRDSGDSSYSHRRDGLVRRAEAMVRRQRPLFPEPIGFEPLDKDKEFIRSRQEFRSYVADMEILALAYLYSGDVRYADEAKRHLLHVLSWDVQGVSRSGGLAMDIAERAYRTYDWIYDRLSADERLFASKVLAQRLAAMHAIHRGLPMETQPFASHPGRMLGFLAEGSIALAHEVPESEVWLDDTLKILWSVYPAWGGPDGGWHEGLLYWRAYIRRILHVVILLDQIGVPLKDKPFFVNTGYFGFYNAFPGQATMGFGDAAGNPPGTGEGSVMLMLSKLYDKPYFKWYAEKLGGDLPLPSAVLLESKTVEPKEPHNLPLSRYFPSVGWVAMHSDFIDIENNITFLFKSSPTGAISHNFANQNAFLIEAFGEPLAIQSGYRSNFHGSPHHKGWKWTTQAHNSLLIDGVGQITRGRNSRGSIVHYEEKGAYTYVVGEAVEAYGGSLDLFDRHVLFKRPDYFLIVDDIVSASGESTYQWLMHAMNEMDIDLNDRTVTVTQGDARLRAQFLSPASMTLDQFSGFDPAPQRSEPTQYPDQFHFTASTDVPADEEKIITLMSVSHADSPTNPLSAQIISKRSPLVLFVDEDLILLNSASGQVHSGLEAANYGLELYETELVFAEDFSSSSWKENWFIETEGASVENTEGGLRISTPESQSDVRMGTTVWFKEELPDHVWIHAQAQVLDTASFNAANLNMILHAREMDGSPYAGGRSGNYPEYHEIPNYIFTFVGGDREGWTRLRENPGFHLLSDQSVRTERGESYDIAILITENRIRCWIDGELIHDQILEDNIKGGSLGLRTWSSDIIWNNLTVRSIH